MMTTGISSQKPITSLPYSYLLTFRCDDTGSPVDLEKCLLRYSESAIGCRSPYHNVTGHSPFPVCNVSETNNLIKEYVKVIDGGEKDIFIISGCLSRLTTKDIYNYRILCFIADICSCRRNEYSLEKVEVEEILPIHPDAIAGTTKFIIFYAGTMYVSMNNF